MNLFDVYKLGMLSESIPDQLKNFEPEDNIFGSKIISFFDENKKHIKPLQEKIASEEKIETTDVLVYLENIKIKDFDGKIRKYFLRNIGDGVIFDSCQSFISYLEKSLFDFGIFNSIGNNFKDALESYIIPNIIEMKWSFFTKNDDEYFSSGYEIEYENGKWNIV